MNKKMLNSCVQEAEEKHLTMIKMHARIARIRDIRAENPGMLLKDSVMVIYHWCEENTLGKWDRASLTTYYFEDETDAMAFKLMWT